MKIGNISQTVLKRSVLKQLHSTRGEAVFAPAVEEMCAGIQVLEEQVALISTAVVYGDEKELGCYGIAKSVNDLASRNVKPIGIDVVIQLPPYAYESRLKAMVGHMERCCSQHHLQILGIKATVNPVIHSAIVNVTAMGHGVKERLLQTSMAKAGMDLVLIGGVGTEGAVRVLHRKEQELESRFIPRFFEELRSYEDKLVQLGAIEKAIQHGALAIHQLSEGGILAALWEIGEAGNLGLEVDIKKMTIRQDVIEVCEFVGVNPYQLSSIGSILVVTDKGEELVYELGKEGVHSVVIGRTTSENERVILNGGEKRFLDRPTQGELMKLYEVEEQGEGND